MSDLHWIAGSILGLVWFWRLADAALGMRKIADVSRPEWDRKPATPDGNPRVSIIVPARDEEADIAEALTRLLTLDYDNYEVIAVDDRSTDRTGEIIDRIAASAKAHGRLKVIHINSLPAGWLGKTHAMWTAAKQASGDWLLFTDADVLFKPDSLRRALAYAEAEPADHVVLLPRMIMKRPGEKMMIAFFQTLFVFGHRPWKVADPKAKDHMGMGAFNLVRRRVYDAIGSYERLRMEVLDDMKLGKVVKNAGYAQRNVFSDGRGAESHQEFFCRHVVPVAAPATLLPGAGIPEPVAVSRNMAGPRLGAAALCRGAGVDVPDLRRGIAEIGGALVLLCPASCEHGAVRVHHAAFDDLDPEPWRRGLAWHVLSAGRIEAGNGVANAWSDCNKEIAAGHLERNLSHASARVCSLRAPTTGP
jgi:hypothetical protein